MQRKLLLGLVLSVALATGAFAQSGSKTKSGSNSRNTSSNSNYKNNNANAMAKKNARMLAKEESKVARQIAKASFGKIKLTKKQKETLASLVHEKYEQIKKYDSQIAASIPSDKTKALGKAYRMATKEGQSKSEAMATSMMKAGVDETVQQKVIGLNKSKQMVMDGIRDALTETLNDEQKTTLAEVAAMMEKKSGDEKEAMTNADKMSKSEKMSKAG